MLRYFRLNDPYRLVGLLVLLLIVYLPIFIDQPQTTLPELKGLIIGEKLNEDQSMYTGVVDNTAPLTAWFNEFMDTLFGRSVLARHIVAFILIFFQAAYFGIMFIMRKAFNESSYIPSLIFGLLFCISFDFISLTGELLGLTFLLLALNNLFKEIESRVQTDETVLNLGVFISLASLCSFAYITFFFCIVTTLLFFTRTTTRKFLLLAFGFLLPHLLLITIAFLNDSIQPLWRYYYLDNLSLSGQNFISAKSLFVLGCVPLVFFVMSLFMLQREARFSKYQSILLQIMFLWLGFAVLYIFFCKNLRPQSLITFIPALTFLFTHFFLLIRRRKFAEMNLWILLIGIVTVSYLARYNKIRAVDYSRLIVQTAALQTNVADKRILILENNPGYLLNNRLATPYLNWRLSEQTFRRPEFYETITEVYQAFKTDPPDVIIDEENLMKPFLDRIPELRSAYRREGKVYKKMVSN